MAPLQAPLQPRRTAPMALLPSLVKGDPIFQTESGSDFMVNLLVSNVGFCFLLFASFALAPGKVGVRGLRGSIGHRVKS